MLSPELFEVEQTWVEVLQGGERYGAIGLQID